MLPAEAEPSFDRMARLACRLAGVPTALVTLVDRHHQVFPGAVGLPEPWQTDRQTPLSHSICQHVVSSSAPLVVDDVRADPLLAATEGLDELGIGAYAGMPLTTRDGTAIGSLCAIDSVPRTWTSEQLADLGDLAAACSTELQLRETAADVLRTASRADALLAAMPVGYIAFDADWRVTAVNGEAARIVDARPEDLLGNVLWELFPATVGSQVETVYRRVAATGVEELLEYFYPEPLNRWYEIRVQRHEEEVSAFFVDITLRRENAALADNILASMPVGFILMDESWVITSVNTLGAELAGSTVERLLGGNLWQMFPALRGSAFETAYRRVAATGTSEVVEAYYPEPLDAWYDVVVVNEAGRVSLYFHDVSERRAMQAVVERQAARDRSVADTLQRALLTRLPSVEGVQLAARYLTATGTEKVGGDWYDAVVEPDGALSVSIGDVCGHGIEAAAGMGQLRAMLRGFLWNDHASIARGVSRLDQAIRGLDGRIIATLVAASISRSETGSVALRWTNAGHLPPLVVWPDGTTEALEAAPELMLGVVPDVPRTDHVRLLPPGTTLLLYTDGLVETRTEAVTDGVRLLQETLARARERDLPDMLDAILDELRPGSREDDVAILAVRIEQIGVGDPVAPLVLASDTRSPALARAYVAEHASSLTVDTLETAQVLVSEIVTNAVLHGEPVVTLRAESDSQGITVTVHDGGDELPAQSPRFPEAESRGGRGIPIVDALASQWGIRTTLGVAGKDVWFSLRNDEAESADADADDLVLRHDRPAVASRPKPMTLSDSTVGAAAILAVAGDVDLDNASKLTARLVSLVRTQGAVVLDVTQLTFIDSIGLNVLVTAAVEAHSAGSRLMIAGPTTRVADLLHLTGLDQLLTIHDSTEQAVDAASN